MIKNMIKNKNLIFFTSLFFKAKKGETQDLTLMNIFLVVFAATVLITITTTIYNFNKTTIYEKEFLATRLSLTIDTLFTTDANIKINYKPQIFEKKFKYKIQENLAEIYDNDGSRKYSFLKQPTTKIISQINDKELEQFKITKNGNDLSFTEQEITPTKTSCPKTENIKSFIIDLGKGYNPDYPEKSNKGIQKNSLTESTIITQIGKILFTRIKNYYPTELTRSYEVAIRNNEVYEDVLSLKERNSKIKNSEKEFLISIHLGNFSQGNIIKAYINAEQEQYEHSYAIACQIVNELTQDLSQNNNIIGSTIIPIITKQQKNENLEVLEQGKPGILIQIGNIDLFENQNNAQQIANSIIEGIQND